MRVLEARTLLLQNTVAVNFAGNPALAMPIPLHLASVPVTSMQLIGPPRSEAELLNAGRLVEAKVRQIDPLWYAQELYRMGGVLGKRVSQIVEPALSRLR